MVRLFEKRAEWFVGAGWLLFVFAIAIALLHQFAAGFQLAYLRHSEKVPYAVAWIHLANAAMVVSVAAAVAPSIALAFRFRVTASALAVVGWSLICALYLSFEFLGVRGVERLTGLGPPQIERYIGSQKFDVPAQYRPGYMDAPNLPGLSFWACGSNFLAGHDTRCGAFTQVIASPAEMGLERQYDVGFWRDRLQEMKTGEVRSGHQEYVYTSSADIHGLATTIRFFVRQTEDGQLSRLVACSSSGNCRHHARVPNYALSYEAPESRFADWDTMDWQLTALIDSWRKGLPQP